MFELQPVRLRDGVDVDGNQTFFDQTFGTFPYDLDISGIDPGTEIEVTARLRFRHLPPYFIRGLEAEQDDLDDRVPEGARIVADDLLDEMVVTDVAVARSGEGEVTECPGPQNEAGRSVFECLPEGGETIGEAVRLGGGLTAAGLGPDGGWLLLFGWVVLALLTPVATARRRLLR
jgi:hypothetical protein